MGYRALVCVFLWALPMLLSAQRKDFRLQFIAMGSAFEVVVVADEDSAEWADAMLLKARKEIDRIEEVISDWSETSELAEVNRMAGIGPVQVSIELLHLTQRSLLIGDITDGAFDITHAGMAGVWRFGTEDRETWPDSTVVAEKAKLVDYQKVKIDTAAQSIFLPLTGMRIGFGGIGKGYAADKTAALLKSLGVKNGVVNASGDLYCWGTDAKGAPWLVAVANPSNQNDVLLWLEASEQSVVTSGDYEKYKMHNGIRYAHIINPKTGYPVSGVKSATVIAPSAELADALATAIFALGLGAGIDLINELAGISCIVIDHNNQMHTSANIDIATK